MSYMSVQNLSFTTIKANEALLSVMFPLPAKITAERGIDGLLCVNAKVAFGSKVLPDIFGSRHSNRQYRQPFQEIASVR